MDLKNDSIEVGYSKYVFYTVNATAFHLKRKIITSDEIVVEIHKVSQQFVGIWDMLPDFGVASHPTADFFYCFLRKSK